MARRQGFTLVELLVVVAVVLIIMVILSLAFGSSLKVLQRAKAIGDMQQNLRTAADLLQRDLAADHFDGRRRCSDRTLSANRPREGFFRILKEARQGSTILEGTDEAGVPSFRVTHRALHFAIKLRGNNTDKMFSAHLPPRSPLAVRGTTYFDLPPDARFQTPNVHNTCNSQWAEVYYHLVAGGTRSSAGLPLFALYRGQYVVLADNSQVAGWVDYNAAAKKDYAELSFRLDPDRPGKVFFNTPMDLAAGSWSELRDPAKIGSLVLTDVLSFEVVGWNRDNWNQWQINPATQQWRYWDYVSYDSTQPAFPLDAVRITLRVWDFRSEQARQITLWQDM